jgi:O-antigen/teichoic acid export membrane protein
LNVFEAYSATLNRITIPKLNRDIIVRFLTVGCILVFTYWHLGVNTFVILFVLIYGIAAFINVSYSFRLTQFESNAQQDSALNSQFYKQILIYMSFMFFAGLGTNIIVRTDTLMISSMLGLDKTGIYTISFFMATMIEIPSKATMMISGPTISRELKLMNIRKVEDIYKKSALNQAIIGGLLLILIWINIDNIFKIMPNGHLFNEGKYVLLIITLAKLYDSITSVNNLIVVYSKHYRIILIYVIIMAILVIAGNYFLIPIFGITGAAIASFAGYFFINTISVLFIYYKFRIQPFKKQIFLIFIFYFVCFLANYLIPAFGNYYLDAVIRSGAIVTIYTAFVYKSKISPELSQLVMNLLNLKGLVNFLKGK